MYGILRSIPLDWFARRYVDKGVKFYLINSFPVPRPSRNDTRWQNVVTLAGRLGCPDERFAEWAQAAGVDYGPLDPDDKKDKIHLLDALVAHLYGLSEPQLVHIFETFHVGWDYQPQLTEVLRHYQAWEGKA